MKYRKQIILPHGEIGKLAASCGVTPKYAAMCLRFAYNSDTANLIRANAIKFHRGIQQKVPL